MHLNDEDWQNGLFKMRKHCRNWANGQKIYVLCSLSNVNKELCTRSCICVNYS